MSSWNINCRDPRFDLIAARYTIIFKCSRRSYFNPVARCDPSHHGGSSVLSQLSKWPSLFLLSHPQLWSLSRCFATVTEDIFIALFGSFLITCLKPEALLSTTMWPETWYSSIKPGLILLSSQSVRGHKVNLAASLQRALKTLALTIVVLNRSNT